MADAGSGENLMPAHITLFLARPWIRRAYVGHVGVCHTIGRTANSSPPSRATMSTFCLMTTPAAARYSPVAHRPGMPQAIIYVLEPVQV